MHSVSCNMIHVTRDETSTVALTPQGLLAAAVAAMPDSQILRQPWAVEVLVEHMLTGVGGDGPGARAVRRLGVDHHRADRRVVRAAVDSLLYNGVVIPVGQGSKSVLLVHSDQRAAVGSVLSTLPVVEAHAVRRASQRAAAMLVAWSKTRTAFGSKRSATSTSADVRRHAR